MKEKIRKPDDLDQALIREDPIEDDEPFDYDVPDRGHRDDPFEDNGDGGNEPGN